MADTKTTNPAPAGASAAQPPASPKPASTKPEVPSDTGKPVTSAKTDDKSVDLGDVKPSKKEESGSLLAKLDEELIKGLKWIRVKLKPKMFHHNVNPDGSRTLAKGGDVIQVSENTLNTFKDKFIPVTKSTDTTEEADSSAAEEEPAA
jgi:hypothetical protein